METMIEVALPQGVAQVRRAMRGLPAPWAVCGGWAVELWLDRPVRDHADADVAVFRADQDVVRDHLRRRGRTLTVVKGGREGPWSGERLDAPVHELRCRRAGGEPGEFELLLNERTPAEFIFRRDHTLRMPIGRAIRAAPCGVDVLAPAIVLLYKSKRTTPRDEVDFDAALPRLDPADRLWLLRGLEALASGHPWIRRLAA